MKRIRVELDVNDAVDVEALRWADVLGRSATSQQATIAVRSVEVVEPERWTELTLRSSPGWDWAPGEKVNVVAAPDGRWEIRWVDNRLVYPSAAE